MYSSPFVISQGCPSLRRPLHRSPPKKSHHRPPSCRRCSNPCSTHSPPPQSDPERCRLGACPRSSPMLDPWPCSQLHDMVQGSPSIDGWTTGRHRHPLQRLLYRAVPGETRYRSLCHRRMDEESCDASARAAWIGQDGHKRVPVDLRDQSPQGRAW